MIETDRLVKEFKARGGRVKWVPCGVSGVVVSKSFYARFMPQYKDRLCRREESYQATLAARCHGGAARKGGGGATRDEQMAVDKKINLMGAA